LTASDLQAYVEAVTSGNLMAMRRVSFLQEDMGGSSKAQRLLELCREAGEDQKRIVVFSYFRETLDKAAEVLKEYVIGEITGSTDVHARQEMIDRFSQSLGGSVLLCQVQAGGFGLNIQAAAVVIFCEPQIKPSLERQAIARVFRMGQIHSVMVFHLLNEDTVDEEIQKILTGKEQDFLLFADESAMAQAVAHLEDREWIRQVVEEQRRKYLPAVISQDFCSDDRRKNS
jgi:SNF2 family DNA or RNA helicase